MTKNSLDVTMDWIRSMKANKIQHKIKLTEYKNGKEIKNED